MSRPLPPRKIDYPRTLTEFKSWLQQPGVRLVEISHAFKPADQSFVHVRYVDNLGFITSDGVHRLFRSSKAWTFRRDLATLAVSAETLHSRTAGLIVYRLYNPNPN